MKPRNAPMSIPKPKNQALVCTDCGFVSESFRHLRSHRRTSCARRMELAESKVNLKNDALRRSSDSVHVREDCKTPPGHIVPDKHHSAEAKVNYRYQRHGVAKKPPEHLQERRKRLFLPTTAEEWKNMNEELKIALPQVLPESQLIDLSKNAVIKFQRYLYDFISQRVPQVDPKDKNARSSAKTGIISRLERDIAMNRSQKKHHNQYVRKLKKKGYFHGVVAASENRLRRKLLKKGNKLRRRLKQAISYTKERRANKAFRSDPHKFARELFKGKCNKATPAVSKESCEKYFPDLYKDSKRSHIYHPLPEMRRPDRPSIPLHLAIPSFTQFSRCVMSKRNAASPGRDGISYLVYKRLPSAMSWLYKIICNAWTGDIPESWAEAAVILLHKEDNPADPKNYRPIALTSCSGKIFFSLWAKRLEAFMLSNKYFKRAKQKGFLHGIAGCSEHIATLKAALKDATKHSRQIVISWIDLKNAFGSVSHNLIQFALRWYHIPEQLANIIFKYYEMLVATIEGCDWSTKSFAYEIGVFQGCVISPLLFNMVFNLLLDCLTHLSTKNGYTLKESKVSVHDLAYADDLTIIAKRIGSAQHSLNLIDRFLTWTRTMAAKPKKCRSLAFKFWTNADDRAGRKRLLNYAYAPFDPKLSISGKPIEFIGESSFKFLGWHVYHHLSENKQKESIQADFTKNMDLIDTSFVHGFMKLWLYQHYAVAYLAWPLMVYDLDVSFASDLQTIANRYLKKWAGLYSRAIVTTLYRPRSEFGLQLCSLVGFYKQLKVSQAFLLKYSPDDTLNKIFAANLARNRTLSRVWRPEPLLESLERQLEYKSRFGGQQDRLGLGMVPRRYGIPKNTEERREHIMDLFRTTLLESYQQEDIKKAMQSCFRRFGDANPFDLSWKHLIGTRNPRLITWVLNASINSVVTPDLRKLWGLTSHSNCPLCGHRQASLFHILVDCSVALSQKRYSWRHDSVLLTLEDKLRQRLSTHNKSPPKKRFKVEFVSSTSSKKRVSNKKKAGAKMSCLLGSATDWKIIIDYTMAPVVFPVHICVTNERPDVVLYSDSLKTVILIELTCPAEENIADARARKEIKYTPLRDQIQDNNWTCHLRTIEVGARGFVSSSVPRCLRQLGFSHSKSKELSRKVSIAAARCSFAIYKCFKVRKWEWFSPVKID